MRLLLALLLLLSAPSRVSIAVLPTIVPAGGTVRVTCTVPRHPDNRWLEIGVYYEGGVVYQSSLRQLDGDTAPITHTMLVDHMPCEAVVASCYLIPAVGPQARAVRAVEVVGCS